MKDISKQKCEPCEGGVPKFTGAQAEEMLEQTPGWRIDKSATHLTREFTFKDFRENMAFLNRVAEVAESEGHHPDFSVHYNRSEFDLSTHSIGGLSANDFILAAKINRLTGSA